MRLVWKVVYRSSRRFARIWRWGQRRFTPAGLAVLGGLFAMSVMSVDIDNTVAYQGFVLLFCVLVIGAGFMGWFRARLAVTRLLPRFGTVGCPFRYTVQVRNLTPKPQGELRLLEDLAEDWPTFPEWLAHQLENERRVRSFHFSQLPQVNPFRMAAVKDAAVPAMPPRQTADVSLELVPLRRGVLRFDGLRVARTDPLGLIRSLVKLPLPQSLLILPKRYSLAPFSLPGAMKYQLGGVAQASNVGQSEDFVALRDYRHGDPLRHIHWRSWAKVGKPVVKEFEDEFFVRHALVLDTFADTAPNEVFEEAISVAASFACTIQTQESLLDLLFVGPQSYCFTAGRGLAHADQMLEILASVRACREHGFAALEHLVLDHITLVSGCICVFLAWDEPRRRFIEKIKALGVPVLVLLVVPAGENQPPDLGPMRDEPDRLLVLEAGNIEQGLARL